MRVGQREEAEMIVLALVVVIVAVGIALSRRQPAPDGVHRGERTRAPAQLPGLRADLDRWVAAGLLTAEESTAILTHDLAEIETGTVGGRRPARSGRIPVAAEALGYLGGILALTGLVLVLSRAWTDLATGGRLALSGFGALVLIGAGALVKESADPALARLRWFLWLASSAAVAVFAGVFADGLDASDEGIALAGASAVAVESALLWQLRARPLQQLTTLAGLVAAAGVGVAVWTSAGEPGLAVWAVGATYVVAGLRWARLPSAPLTESVGALALVIGAGLAAGSWQGFGWPFLVSTAFGVLAVATVPGVLPAGHSALPLLLVGGATLVQSVPGTIAYFAQEAGVATGLVTWTAGGLLLLIGTRQLVRTPLPAQVLGGLAMVGGAAVTGAQSDAFAPVFGLLTAIGLVGLGTLPGQVLLSVFGSLGLLVNVPWAIGRFFPGEARAPLLILVAGLVIIGVAVLLTRLGGRFRTELGGHRHHGPPAAPAGL